MVHVDLSRPPGRVLLVSGVGTGEHRCCRLAEALRRRCGADALTLLPDHTLEHAERSRRLGDDVERFAPDLIVVDRDPVGPDGELWMPFLRYVAARRRPRLVLLLPAWFGEPARVDARWRRLDAWTAVDWLYDQVLAFGEPRAGTTATDLALHRRISGEVRYLGDVDDGGVERAADEIADLLARPLAGAAVAH